MLVKKESTFLKGMSEGGIFPPLCTLILGLIGANSGGIFLKNEDFNQKFGIKHLEGICISICAY